MPLSSDIVGGLVDAKKLNDANEARECTVVTASRIKFSGYNRNEDDLTPHIMVCTHAQALAGVLGGFSCLPAALSGGAAFACPRQPLCRRLSSFILKILNWPDQAVVRFAFRPKASTRNLF